ncbi:hypothetical protein [uncultured Sphingomonas sp.]|uniref:tail completion protein gp17 n=1 Tax=uncultured Sphingomonas sp. TaxID=158754 RepID=UPI0025D85B18|nr:hypothetical protein [uncultured Sphingomonas sp.]
MSGVSIIGALLAAHKALRDLVPEDRIKAGRLPDGVKLPALLVRTVSSGEWQALERGDNVPTTDRVSVTVRAASYRDQKAVMKLIVAACAGRTGMIADFNRVAVLTAGAGPDVAGPADSFEQTQDFRVSFDAPQ